MYNRQMQGGGYDALKERAQTCTMMEMVGPNQRDRGVQRWQ